MAQASWGDVGQPLQKLEFVPQDESWLKLIPEGAEVIRAIGHGASFWSQSGKIEVHLANGSTTNYFIKLTPTPLGKMMCEGEFESMKLLHTANPKLVPKPVDWGTFISDDNIHFYMCEFVDLYDEIPDVVDFTRELAETHRASIELNSTGEFGFRVTTCNGTVPQYTDWNVTCEGFFIEFLKDHFRLEEQARGPFPEIAELLPPLYEEVCPRLLRPLETDGRELRPCLVHGDIWEGNAAVAARTGQPCMFDASALWAHNEYDLHQMRPVRYRMGRTFVREYFNYFLISPPEDDWEERHHLYSLIADLHSSTLHKRTPRFRQLLLQSVEDLVNKFPNGYEGSAEMKTKGEVKDDQATGPGAAVPADTLNGDEEGQVDTNNIENEIPQNLSDAQDALVGDSYQMAKEQSSDAGLSTVTLS